MGDINELKELIRSVISTRGKNRQNKINLSSNAVYMHYKNSGLLTIPREYLNNLVTDLKVTNRQKENIVNEIISNLSIDKKIEKKVIKKYVHYWENKNLSSNDTQSYSLMMSKNGYQRILYKRNGLKRNKVITLSMNDKLIDNEVINPLSDEPLSIWNESEIDSYKPRSSQGVYTNGIKSVTRRVFIVPQEVYYLK
ncbi:MAG TPA: hypothetical protein VIR31_05810 [Nitrososphaeraceae archaeon]